MLEDVMYAVEDGPGMSSQTVVEMVVNHTVLLQNVEHLGNSGFVVGSSMVNDGVKSVYQVHVSNFSIHISLIKG